MGMYDLSEWNLWDDKDCNDDKECKDCEYTNCKLREKEIKCTCGAEKCKSPKHSDWCDKYQK